MLKKIYLSFILLFILLEPIAVLHSLAETNYKNVKMDWSPPALLSPAEQNTMATPSIAVDFLNRPHVVWYKIVNITAEEIYYTYLDNNVWTIPANISNTVTPSLEPILLSDSIGIMHLLWGERIGTVSPRPPQPPTDIFYKQKNESGWTTNESIYHHETETGFPRPSGQTDSYGGLSIVWQTPSDDTLNGPPSIKFRHMNSSGWDSIKDVNSAGIMPSIAVEGNSKAHVIFIAGTGANNINSVFYTSSTNNGNSWSDSLLIHFSGMQPAFFPQIIKDRLGYIHVFWLKDFDNNLFPDAVFHTYSSDGINWEAEQNITQNLSGYFFSFSTAADAQGNIHIVMQGNGHLYYSSFNHSTWEEPKNLFNSTNATEVSLTCDKTNRLHLAWADYSLTPPGIYYSYYDIPLSVSDNTESSTEFELFQNYPNPFNLVTQIKYVLPEELKVEINVYDIIGNKISELVNEVKPKGNYDITFDASNLSSGVYFCKINSYKGKKIIYSQTRKMTLLK